MPPVPRQPATHKHALAVSAYNSNAAHQKRTASSFSEEKEAKGLLFLRCCNMVFLFAAPGSKSA
jgi:hypothetical protein